MRWPAVLAAAAIAVGVAGCSPAGTDQGTGQPGAGTSASPARADPTRATHPPDSDKVYALPKSMCVAADLSAMTDLYPQQEEKPLLDTARTCGTAVLSSTTVVSVEVRADLMPDARRARLLYETSRNQARNTPHDIAGAGTEAFWAGTETETKLTSYHGNLLLTITCATVRNQQTLPPDIADRMVRIAAGTFARLGS